MAREWKTPAELPVSAEKTLSYLKERCFCGHLRYAEGQDGGHAQPAAVNSYYAEPCQNIDCDCSHYRDPPR